MKKQKILLIVLTIGIAITANSQKYQWNILGDSKIGNTKIFNGGVNTIVIDTSSKVYAAGYCTNTNKKYFVGIWNGTSWDELGGINTSNFNGAINCSAVDKSNNLYIGGKFKNAKGNYYVAVWNGSLWSELGGNNTSTFNGEIACVTTDKNGNLFAGGYFKNANGNYYVAWWNGNSWREIGGINTSTFNGPIYNMVTDRSGYLYAIGDFLDPIGRSYVALLNGSSWSELGGGTSTSFSSIKGITTDANGNIYATHYNYIEKWDGAAWSVLDSNINTFNNYISYVTTDKIGNVYAVGQFTDALHRTYVAKYDRSAWKNLGYPGSLMQGIDPDISFVTTDINGNIYTTTNSGSSIYIEEYRPTGLPLLLANIIASTEHRDIVLDWQTASELNNNYFIIQHSLDGSFFKDIGTVKAVGGGANSYSFRDNSPTNGSNYYRLKSVDKDGSSTYSKVVSINFSNNESISIIPNPAKDLTIINFSNSQDNAIISVYDISGKLVIKKTLKGSLLNYHLNTEDLKSGIYAIKISCPSGDFNKKLLINK